MNWTFASPDAMVALDLVAQEAEPALTGTLTFRWPSRSDLPAYSASVSGNWAAWDSSLGRNYSAFSLSGRTHQNFSPAFISASGILSDDFRMTIRMTLNQLGAVEQFWGPIILVSSQARTQDALRAFCLAQMMKRSKQLADAVSLDMAEFRH